MNPLLESTIKRLPYKYSFVACLWIVCHRIMKIAAGNEFGPRSVATCRHMVFAHQALSPMIGTFRPRISMFQPTACTLL